MKQKVWFYVFLLMFVLPEILFSFILSPMLYLLGINASYLMEKFFGEQFFIDNKNILFLGMIIEALGLLGLLICSVKFNRSWLKVISSLFFLLLFILIILILYTAFYMRHGIGF